MSLEQTNAAGYAKFIDTMLVSLPTCDMTADCARSVTMIDDKGFVYCEGHGLSRRGWGTYRQRVRKLRPHEINRLARGQQIKSY